MITSAHPSDSSPDSDAETVRLAELRRGATLGLLRLEIESIRLRLEIESLWRTPPIREPAEEPVIAEDAWLVRIDAVGLKKRRNAAGRLPGHRLFRLTTGKVALQPTALGLSDTQALLAAARELVSVLEAELRGQTAAA